MEQRLRTVGQDLGKLRKKGKPAASEEGDGDGAASAPPAVTSEDLDAAMELGRLSSSLPKEGQAELARFAEEGASFQDRLRIVKAMLSVAKPADENSKGTPPPAHGGTPARSSRSVPNLS